MRLDDLVKRRPNAALCFILSAPRSGSTWLKTALDAHPDIFCTENRLFGPHADFVRDHDVDRPRLRITLEGYLEGFLDPFNVTGLEWSRDECRARLLADLAGTIVAFCRDASGKPIIADKVTPYQGTAARVVEMITSIFPQAKIVHLCRDGRDVLVSGAFHWLTKSIDGRPTSAIAARRREFLLGGSAAGGRIERFLADDEIEQWAMMWREPIEAARSIRNRASILEVSYEGMKSGQAECLASVCRFLGARTDAAVIDAMVDASCFQRMSGGRQPGEVDPSAGVRKGVVGDWRGYLTHEDGARFDALAGDELVSLGYAEDRGWFESLPATLDRAPVASA